MFFFAQSIAYKKTAKETVRELTLGLETEQKLEVDLVVVKMEAKATSKQFFVKEWKTNKRVRPAEQEQGIELTTMQN